MKARLNKTATSKSCVSRAALVRMITRYTAAHLAVRLGCDESAVRLWAGGRRTPTRKWQKKMHEVLGLAVDGWGEPAACRAPATPPSSATSSRLTALKGELVTVGGDDTSAQYEALIERLHTLEQEAAGDQLCSYRDRAAIAGVRLAAVKALAKHRGSDSASLERILRSPMWKRIELAMAIATKDFPEVARSIALQLQKLEEEP